MEIPTVVWAVLFIGSIFGVAFTLALMSRLTRNLTLWSKGIFLESAINFCPIFVLSVMALITEGWDFFLTIFFYMPLCTISIQVFFSRLLLNNLWGKYANTVVLVTLIAIIGPSFILTVFSFFYLISDGILGIISALNLFILYNLIVFITLSFTKRKIVFIPNLLILLFTIFSVGTVFSGLAIRPNLPYWCATIFAIRC
jgi:hypothetical protein